MFWGHSLRNIGRRNEVNRNVHILKVGFPILWKCVTERVWWGGFTQNSMKSMLDWLLQNVIISCGWILKSLKIKPSKGERHWYLSPPVWGHKLKATLALKSQNTWNHKIKRAAASGMERKASAMCEIKKRQSPLITLRKQSSKKVRVLAVIASKSKIISDLHQ